MNFFRALVATSYHHSESLPTLWRPEKVEGFSLSYMRSPAFQFYPSNYLGSRAVRLMDAEQRGWYTQLLFESWESEPQATLPNDDALLRVLAGVNTRSTDVEQRWSFVKAQFKQKGKLLYNSRLLEEFAKQDENREKKKRAGEASGEARRAQREAVKAQHLSRNGNRNTRSTPVPIRSDSARTEGEQNRTLKAPTPVQSPDPISEEKKRDKRTDKPSDPRSKLPAIVAVRSITGKFPHLDIYDAVIAALGEHPDIELLKKCWSAWRIKDFKATNYGWVVDWYVNGIPGETNGKNRSGYEAASERNARNLRENAAYIRGLSDDGSAADSQDSVGLLATRL